ncbi:MAG TPA: alginate lyase family protein [Polyangiaceae bacterium]
MKRLRLLLGISALFAVAVLGLACVRYGMRRAANEEQKPERPRYTPVAGLEDAKLRLAAPSPGNRRLLLDARALGRLRESAQKKTPAFGYLVARADEVTNKQVKSGYQGFEWADAVASASLAWHATGDTRYAEAAVGYVRALLDDRYVVGDGKGGRDVVTYDSGYGIRTFAAYSALGYDWLRGAPGMDEALRARILERLGEWLAWYEEKGYLRDRPTANYYWGYLTAASFAGLAASGESAAADRWLKLARDELSNNVLPAFREELKGGGWPEGAQYGAYTTAEIALVAEAFRTGAGIDVTSKLPWLEQTVTQHVHALLPDEGTVYDGGTWTEHPARPSALPLAAASIALETVNPTRAAEARFMVRNALPPLRREQAWIGLLADRPGGAERNPREGAPASLHVPGMGLTFVRSDWSKNALWASFQAGPRLAEDHQDNDQGHFVLARGADLLLVDGGGSEGSATINHNTILVDDGGRHLTYPPNQGVWGARKVKTTRFADDGEVAVATGDIGEAYAPSCARDNCDDRSVERLIRTFVVVRPATLVIQDAVVLERPEFSVTFAAHLTTEPRVNGSVTSAVVGKSRVDVRTLVPGDAKPVVLREPTPSGKGPHRLNQPWGPMWRLEVPSPSGNRERELLHFVTTGAADSPPVAAELLRGKGLHGGAARVEGRRIVVLFAEDGSTEHSVSLGGAADIATVVNLSPGKRYRVELDPGPCSLRLGESKDGRDRQATSGGFLRIDASRCVSK